MVRHNLGLVIEELDVFRRCPSERASIKWNGVVSVSTRQGIVELFEQARAVRVKAEQKELIKLLHEKDKSFEESDLYD